MLRRRPPPLRSYCVLFVLLAGCAVQQAPSPDAEQHLTSAEALVRNGAMVQAQEVLTMLEGDACPKRLRDRRDIALAATHMGLDASWDAYLVLEPFLDLYPNSDRRPTVVEMVWEIGRRLSGSTRGFWFFWSDRRGGRTVLEHLITRHPDTPRLADALRLLGDMAYEDGNFELAQERFRELLKQRPESEWVKYARFRFAMSIFDSLQGPEYDLDKMSLASRELRDFLHETTENPDLVAKAQAALTQLLDWQAERHLQIAKFYRRVGNLAGQRYHLDIAASPEFATTAAHATAEARRRELDATAVESPALAP